MNYLCEKLSSDLIFDIKSLKIKHIYCKSYKNHEKLNLYCYYLYCWGKNCINISK